MILILRTRYLPMIRQSKGKTITIKELCAKASPKRRCKTDEMARVIPQPGHLSPKIALDIHTELPPSHTSAGNINKIKPRLRIASEPIRAKRGLRLSFDEWIAI